MKGDIIMKKLMQGVAAKVLCLLMAGVIAVAVIPATTVHGAVVAYEQEAAFQPFDLLPLKPVEEE